MPDGADILGPAWASVPSAGGQGADGLRQRRFGLRDIGAGHLADPEAVLRRFELLLQHLDVVAVDLDQGLVFDHVEISLGHRLEYRGFDRQGLRPRRLDRVYRLTRLRQRAAAGVDRLGDLQIEVVLIKGQIRSRHRRLRKTAASAADLAGEVDGRAPARQRLRHLLVGRPQQGALRQELRVGVVGLGQRLGQRLPDRLRCAGREQAGKSGKAGKGRDNPAAGAAENQARGSWSSGRPCWRTLQLRT